MALTVNKRGLVDDPTYRCIKVGGYCRLRTMDTDSFQCIFDGKSCPYRLVKERKK